jgi:hypothetical protein
MSDPDHHLYPLFPTGYRTSLPPEALEGETEPEVGQAGDPEEDAVAGDESGEDTQTTERASALLAAQGNSLCAKRLCAEVMLRCSQYSPWQHARLSTAWDAREQAATAPMLAAVGSESQGCPEKAVAAMIV